MLSWEDLQFLDIGPISSARNWDLNPNSEKKFWLKLKLMKTASGTNTQSISFAFSTGIVREN